MSEPEFPPELIARCRRSPNTRTDLAERTVIAVLCESGHAELVAALKDALPYVKAQARFSGDKRAQAIAQECNSALAKAGAL